MVNVGFARELPNAMQMRYVRAFGVMVNGIEMNVTMAVLASAVHILKLERYRED